MEKVEIERRWLLVDKKSLDLPHEVIQITQFYLKNEQNYTERIRQSITSDGSQIYTHTIKKPRNGDGDGQIEIEETIEYEMLLDLVDRINPKGNTIIKDRKVFLFEGRKFELDEFVHPVQFRILELELDDLSEDVKIPDFLGRMIEITNEKSLSNYKISFYPDAAVKKAKEIVKANIKKKD